MRGWLIAALAVVGGCASTPAQLRQAEPMVRFETDQPARETAQCLGRGAESYPKLFGIDQFAAVWREGEAAGAYEVIVRRVGSVPLLIADVVGSAGGSKVTIWQSGALLVDGDLGVEMGKACRARNIVVRELPDSPQSPQSR